MGVVSASGMLAVFSAEVDLWTEGDLLLHYGDSSYILRSRAARPNGLEAGISFKVRTSADRDAVDAILQFALTNTHLVGRPPF